MAYRCSVSFVMDYVVQSPRRTDLVCLCGYTRYRRRVKSDSTVLDANGLSKGRTNLSRLRLFSVLLRHFVLIPSLKAFQLQPGVRSKLSYAPHLSRCKTHVVDRVGTLQQSSYAALR